jgi:hypothetical protein
MGRTPHDHIDYTTEFDDLFGESTKASSGDFDDLSIPSCIYEPVLVGLEGRKLETLLEKGFYPRHDNEVIVRNVDGTPLAIPIEDIQYLAFANRPLQIEKAPISSFTDIVELYRGGSHSIHVSVDRDIESGLYGVIPEAADRYRYIFFSYDNIRLRFQQRLLGEIIVALDILPEETIQNALRRQAQLRKLRIGTIIAKKINRPIPEIEQVIQQASRAKSAAASRQHVGDILTAAGLVSPEIVGQSLAFQKQIRSMKLGNLLMIMGYLNENQFYRVLAEKFRKKFIDLQENLPTDRALQHFPPDLIKKLSIVPVYFQKQRLVVATSHPDKAEINDILRQQLSCPFELAVAVPHQIRDVLADLRFS